MAYTLWLRLAIAGVGVLAVAWALRRRAMFSLIRGTPVVDAADAQPGDRVAVSGTVELVDDDAVVRPEFQDDDAVVAAWRTEEFRTHRQHTDSPTDVVDDGQTFSQNWEEVSTGYRSTPFYVRDDTGRVLVDAGANVRNEPAGVAATGTLGNSVTDGETVVSFSSFEAHTPKSFDVTAAEAAGASGQQESIEVPFSPGAEDGEREHEEATLEPGDDVFVLGEVTRTAVDVDTDARSERTVVARDSGPFVLSDRGRTELLVHSGFAFPAAVVGVALVAFAALAF
ncbi:GIDE domain-containing protein [Halorubellus litoreus]|uniref:RING-type E3 ubiquitin transferase n=1 Tax=Halorubellus litoreus TaxID=755308 RepID=A0ABD5VFH9_9EURY